MSTKAFSLSALVALTSIFGSANAHIKLTQPVPYGKSSLQLGPIAADGSDFPCQQRKGVYDLEGASNSYAVGESVPLQFEGSASHGGGSCQISLSTDKAPTKSSKWKVIHSIEGGCPSKSATGNGGTDSYTFKIPSEVAPGDYTLAWTWFNKVGNREMYMNCAPFTVTGSKKRSSENMINMIKARNSYPLAFKPSLDLARRDNSSSSLPDIYVANICGSSCVAAGEGEILAFPDPGKYLDTYVNQNVASATCSCDPNSIAATVAPNGAGSGTGLVTSSNASPSMVNSGSGASSSASAPVATSGSGNGVLSIAVSTATVVSTAAPKAAATGSSTSGSNGTSASTGSNQSCTGSAVVCSSDGGMFGLCNGGSAVMQAVAPGTKCVGGAIAAA